MLCWLAFISVSHTLRMSVNCSRINLENIMSHSESFQHKPRKMNWKYSTPSQDVGVQNSLSLATHLECVFNQYPYSYKFYVKAKEMMKVMT